MNTLPDRSNHPSFYDPDYGRTVDTEALMDQATEQAMREFEDGELDEQIRERVIDEPTDATAIALHHCFRTLRHEPACSVKDFTATVQWVIDQRIGEIYEELLP